MTTSAPASSVLQQLTGLFAAPESLVLISRVDNGQVVALSPGFASVLGITEAQALGRTSMDLGLWRDQANRDSIVELLRQRGAVIAEPVSIEAANGRHLDGLMTNLIIQHEGAAHFFALIQDIREHASEAAARTRELHSNRALIMQSQVGFYRINLHEGALVEVNPALARMLGFASTTALLASALCRHGFRYVDPALAEQNRATLERTGELTDIRCQIHCADGSVRWVSESARLVRDSNGRPLQREGTLLDISVQVQAEQALVQSEMLYRNLVENSRDGVFLMQQGRVLFANDALASILGQDPQQLIGASYFDWVAPDDLKAQQARRHAREGGSDQTQEYDIRLIRSDGSHRLCAVRAGAVMFAGAPASIGTLRDITESRAQQRRLEAAEERYRLLFQHAVLGMFQTALDGRIIEINQAMAQMFGYASPEHMRREVASMLPCYASAQDRERVLRIIQRDGQMLGEEVELVRRDGSHFWALSSARLVRNGPDDPGHLEGSLLDNSARRLAEDELKYLAGYDSLTRLINRRSFEHDLKQAIRELADDPAAVRAVLLLDLDRFKLVNDSLGHAAGDELLVKFADRLREDLGHRAQLARYGGDEFALLSRAAVDSRGAVALAQAVQQLVATPFQLRGHQVFTGASIGIVLLDDFDASPESVMRDADTAMFRAKAAGGGQHALFDSAMHNAARERLALETELRFALERGELLPFYQPVVALDDRRIVGVEALVRWQHPGRGLLAPAHFLMVAEETGMLPAIDLLVLEQALQQLARWHRQYGERAPQRLSVNISDRLFAASDFPQVLRQLLIRYGTAPARLHLEITETVFRGSAAVLRHTLHALKALGVKLVVDDFGTGYSSLVSFSESAFDGLKIDRGFVHDLERNPRHRAIVRTITGFAHDLDLSLVAEGVENEMQVQLLRQLGCDHAQGFHFAPALPAAALEARLGRLEDGDGEIWVSQSA